MDKLEDLVYKAVHSGEGISIDLRKKIYNQALDDAIEFFMNHIHCNNDKPIVKDYVCEQLEKMKK